MNVTSKTNRAKRYRNNEKRFLKCGLETRIHGIFVICLNRQYAEKESPESSQECTKLCKALEVLATALSVTLRDGKHISPDFVNTQVREHCLC